MSGGVEGIEKLQNTPADDGGIKCGSLRQERVFELSDDTGVPAICGVRLRLGSFHGCGSFEERKRRRVESPSFSPHLHLGFYSYGFALLLS